MAEGTSTPISSERQSDAYRGSDGPRGDRSSGPREGGFRIRLSDNEMRSARALQEAFGLRSTVAVLGFALRTLGQQLEEGKLDELAAQHRAQMGTRPGGGGGRPEARRDRPEGGRPPGGRWQEGRGGGGRGPKVDPFARPSRPSAAPEAAEESPLEEAPAELLNAEFAEVPPAPAVSDSPAQTVPESVAPGQSAPGQPSLEPDPTPAPVVAEATPTPEE